MQMEPQGFGNMSEVIMNCRKCVRSFLYIVLVFNYFLTIFLLTLYAVFITTQKLDVCTWTLRSLVRSVGIRYRYGLTENECFWFGVYTLILVLWLTVTNKVIMNTGIQFCRKTPVFNLENLHSNNNNRNIQGLQFSNCRGVILSDVFSHLLHCQNLTTYLRYLMCRGSVPFWTSRAAVVSVVICSVALWVLHSFFREFCLAVAIILLPCSMFGLVGSVCSAEGICCRFLIGIQSISVPFPWYFVHLWPMKAFCPVFILYCIETLLLASCLFLSCRWIHVSFMDKLSS